mmetsp:Transcript_74211/g.204808  ORF Transcript_74211/g.204808 Transcript_74211/m.204808 type:complete len:232 (+) Transcript_74211:82-777(+)
MHRPLAGAARATQDMSAQSALTAKRSAAPASTVDAACRLRALSQSTSQPSTSTSSGSAARLPTLSTPVVKYRQWRPTTPRHSSDLLPASEPVFAQYTVHFSNSHGVSCLPICGSSARQLLMQRLTNSLLQTLVYLGAQVARSKNASLPGGQVSQSLKRVEPAWETRGPSRPGRSLSGHLLNVSQPSQKSPGAHRMHSGMPSQESSIWSVPKHIDSLHVAQHLKYPSGHTGS